MDEQTDYREKKRKKFHRALINLYHPPSPPPPPPPPPPPLPQLTKEEVLPMVLGDKDLSLDLDEGDAVDVECNSSPSHASDSTSKKLTRAQRKRLRKSKLKEAASVRRKIVGPLLPSSSYHDPQHESSQKPLQENLGDPG